MRIKPTFHPDFQVGMKVSFCLDSLKRGPRLTGRIVGVAIEHIINHYIILLDKPLDVPGWSVPWEAVSLPGVQLSEVP